MWIFVLLLIVAFVGESIDSCLGMMYGTILSPLLMAAGYPPRVVVPAILLSQAIGGTVATTEHHRRGNADLSVGTKDFKTAGFLALAGVAASGVGVALACKLPACVLRLYVGALVMLMGLVVVARKRFRFSWSKVAALGILSAFNKALSGGGYGPLTTSGLIISGRSGKEAVAVTDFAEVPICLAALIFWCALGDRGWYSSSLIAPLCIGAGAGALAGPLLLTKIAPEKVRTVVGVLVVLLGIGCFSGALSP
jgi:uncharacterized membrane protein YfcA